MVRRVAFTLVELLVVIGIIAVLMGILFPIVSKARLNAQTAGCASNMKQIYLATMAYCTDNSDTLYYAPPYQDTVTPMDYPYPYRMVSAGVIDYTQGVLWRYMGTSIASRQAILNCPGDVGEPPHNMPTVVRNFSYSFNGTLNWLVGQQTYTGQPNSQTTQTHITSIPSPWHKILIWEEVGPNDGWCACLGDPDDFPSQRHGLFGKNASNYDTNPHDPGGGFGNQCFADGHIELVGPFLVWNKIYYCNLHVEGIPGQ